MNYKENRRNKYFNQPEDNNHFLDYLQSLTPETISQLSQPQSQEVFQVMERNIMGMLGTLPAEHFGVMISTNRENLGRLLASAMMSGYFLRNAEQRMDFEKALSTGEDYQDSNNF
ncbi:DUF760 domain-containing protein [Geminocystis sp. GBBB08]|uniref:DUF760 domain-containing protein n=1 Tax=Geminocystis sp. GBBB08 TaxID=2604140 RepID=UPI0027E241E4|nr:DUF760 domain-containing protein [Geminocystis sp. GBBB08]MBL1210019.1 DUF760 domain-containing protein [Geminocystis sp. GBBB08]